MESEFNPPQPLVDRIELYLTPESIVFGADFEWEKEMIHPYRYPTFDSLLHCREDVRDLRLLPVKWPWDRQVYHECRDEFIKTTVESYKQYDILLAPNLFPDALPDDLLQYIIWIKDEHTTQREIAKFIVGFMQSFDLSTSDVLFLERPFNTDEKLIRGTVKNFRHVHVWIRNLCLSGGKKNERHPSLEVPSYSAP